MVLYNVGWFWPVIYCSGRFWHHLWIDFWRSAFILILHDGYGYFSMILAISGWFLLLLHGYGRFLGLLMVLYGVGWFWPVIYGSGRFWHHLWIDFWRSFLI